MQLTCFNRTGMILFSYLTDFNYFPLSFFFWTQSEQVKNDRFERGCRWFQLFYLLARIIPDRTSAG
jgi:hypothetical protein